MKISVVILNWNAQHLLQQFLPAVVQHSTLPEGMGDVEVVVADNGSTDGSEAYVNTLAAQCPQRLRFLPLGQNWGFAEGYNRALEHVEAEYVVLLNDDVEVTPRWLERLVAYMDAHPEVAACQPRLMSWKEPERFEYAGACGGYLDRYGYPFCRGRVFSTVETDRGQYATASGLLWATGACLLIRLRDYREAGGLDGRFFAHMEEVDLCWRLCCRRREVACVTESTVFHVGGASLAAGSPRKTYLNFRNNLLLLYKNLPDAELRRVLLTRSILDVVAAFVFLLKGEPKNFLAVFRARRDFRRMKPSFLPSRQDNLRAAAAAGNASMQAQGRTPFSLLWRYHIRKQDTYTQLTNL